MAFVETKTSGIALRLKGELLCFKGIWNAMLFHLLILSNNYIPLFDTYAFRFNSDDFILFWRLYWEVAADLISPGNAQPSHIAFERPQKSCAICSKPC